MRPPQRKTPVKRLYRPGLGGVGIIDAALDEQNQQEQKDREQDVALANVQLKMELEDAALTGAQRQKLLRARRAKARLNAKLAVHRTNNEKETAAALEAATKAAFDAALKQLQKEHEKVGFSVTEWNEKKCAIFDAFYPTEPSSKMPSMSQGRYLTGVQGAPRGTGRLVTGGFDSTKLDKIHGASRLDHGDIEPWYGEGKNRQNHPEGNSIDRDKQKGSQHKIFDVKLGDDYKLTPLQKKLDALISKHKVVLETLRKDHDAVGWKTNDPEARRRTEQEDVRMKLEFLERAAAGLIPTEIAERVVPLISRDLAALETTVTG